MKQIFNGFLAMIVAFFALLCAPMVALAQTIVPPDTIDQATGLLPAIIDAIINQKWIVLASCIVMILTVVFRQVVLPKLNIGTGTLPFVALGIAILNGIAAHTFGNVPVKEAAYMVLISGGLASQFWSLGGKFFIDLIIKAFGKKLAE